MSQDDNKRDNLNLEVADVIQQERAQLSKSFKVKRISFQNEHQICLPRFANTQLMNSQKERDCAKCDQDFIGDKDKESNLSNDESLFSSTDNRLKEKPQQA